MKRVLLILIGLAAFPTAAVGENYDPAGFHECILENIKGDMGQHAVVAIRQSCAYINGTTMGGTRKSPQREPFSMLGIADDSIFATIKESPEFTTFSNTQIVELVRREHYPDRSYEWVKDYLINTTWQDR